MSFTLKTEEIPEGEDPHLLLEVGPGASLKITLHFEGSWTEIYRVPDEAEEEARNALAGDIFQLVLSQFK